MGREIHSRPHLPGPLSGWDRAERDAGGNQSLMQDSSLTTSYIYDGDTRAKLSLWGGDYYWEFINDPAASIPAVLVSKGHTDLETTYVYYVREPGGELLASFDSAETPNTLYYHFDDLGSTVLTTDGSGGDLGHSTYRAWGWPTTSDPGPYLFCGRLGYYEHIQDQNWLEQSSLLQLGVRFYDRDMGRFTQRDAVPATGLSCYVYGDDRPILYVDATGLYTDLGGCAATHLNDWIKEINRRLGRSACAKAIKDAGITECLKPNLAGLEIRCGRCMEDGKRVPGYTNGEPPYKICIDTTCCTSSDPLHEAVHACRLKLGLVTRDPVPGEWTCYRPTCRRHWGSRRAPHPFCNEEQIAEEVRHKCGFPR